MKTNLKQLKGTSAVIGVDWGDSGKGRLIDDLAQNAHIVARYNGGSNTGHTVKNQYGKFALHIIPSGIFNKQALCIVGRGVVVDLESLIEDEFKQLQAKKVTYRNLRIDQQATLTMPWHKLKDGLREESRKSKIGTTKRGVGPAYADRVERSGIRVKDLFEKDFKTKLKDEIEFQNKHFNLNLNYQKILKTYLKYAKLISPFVAITIPIVKEAIKSGKNVLFEGAQGYFLDIDAGTYPFVTSSNTGVLGICKSYDLYPTQIENVIGITKSYMTRVGEGPMPTFIKGEQREKIIETGQEIGTTSGRVRDPGWLDLVLIKAACQNNRVTHLALTKLDVLSGFKSIKLCIGYKLGGKTVEYVSGDADFLAKVTPVYIELAGWSEDISKIRDFDKLPQNAKAYIRKIEQVTNVPVSFIGVGPERSEVIYV